MRYLAFLALLLMSVALVASGFALKERFDQGRQTRTAICRSENVLRKILHDEHLRKMQSQIDFLRTHPRGIPGIPRQLIVKAIADERRIAVQTEPNSCE